jgi:L-threonylcarbamoyladenylate synthase
LPVTAHPATQAGIAACAETLKQGGLVAMPTETVYGLAGDATNADAIAAIYATKDRPQFNPLICHIGDMAAARVIGVFNETAEKLAAAFWPGPLTLVVPRQAICAVDPLASAGLDTIALRMPAHETARALLQAVGLPLVAPSANPSGRLSPSSAAHVRAMLPDMDVLDGGACTIGVESSIVGCLDDTPLWLRAGGLARQDIEACLGRALSDPPQEKGEEARLAPGRLARHYAPHSPLRLNALSAQDDELLIGFGADAPAACFANLSATGNLAEAAAQLFAVLHEADAAAQKSGQGLAFMPIPAQGLGEAINDRLARAAA